MVWGLKTPVNTGVSALGFGKTKTRALASACIGILFVFCAPGQLNSANYASSIVVAQNPISSTYERVELRDVSQVVPVSKMANNTPEIVVKNDPLEASKSEVMSIKIAPKTQEPVQLASLDLDIPEITKPRDFVPNSRPEPKLPPPILRSTPKLQKKLFGSVELKFEDERKIKAWSGVYERFQSDVNELNSCLSTGCANPILANWAQELRPFQKLSKFQKITAVNTLVNRRMYADDRRNYGRSDYWASPSEFLTRGGDCEDYAILKFASLLALGVEDHDMRLVVGRLSNGTPHAFLATNVGNQEYILDNREAQVYLTNNRKDYVPKYSMNLSNRWSHVMPGARRT